MAAAHLRAEDPSSQGALRFSFEEGEEWILGRDPDECSFVLEDPKVSRKHALLKKSEEGILLTNLSETNPVLLNEEPFEGEELLHHGDRLKIGSGSFLFEEEIRIVGDISPLSPEALPATEPDEYEHHDTIYKSPAEMEDEEPLFSLQTQGRWTLKVIAGPNTGAESHMEEGHRYLLGHDATQCDIIFQDKSVSKRHAEITIDEEGTLRIKDLESRNQVLVDGQAIAEETALCSNTFVTLGTTTFVLIDKEEPSHTIVSVPPPQASIHPVEEKTPPPLDEAQLEQRIKKIILQDKEILSLEQKQKEQEKQRHQTLLSSKSALTFLFVLATLMIFGIGSLFKSADIEPNRVEFQEKIANEIEGFNDVQFTFNRSNGKLFLMGHVLTQAQHSQLLYNLQQLPFILAIEDRIVIDEGVWQEMNFILGKHPQWRGVNVHSPGVGQYELTGYLKTRAEADELNTFVHLNFRYLERLTNHVVVEEDIIDEIASRLFEGGFLEVSLEVNSGEISLTGFINGQNRERFDSILTRFESIRGVRAVRNFTVEVDSTNDSVVDVSGTYKVSGYTSHDKTNVSVVINGRIMSLGDRVDGMKITSIDPGYIILEREGIQYRIDYNK